MSVIHKAWYDLPDYPPRTPRPRQRHRVSRWVARRLRAAADVIQPNDDRRMK